MSRKLSDMTEDERSAYRIWESILKSDMSHESEKERARKELDALEWKGSTGPVMERIGDIEDRLQSIEVLKGNRKFPVTKKDMEKAKSDIVSLQTNVRDIREGSESVDMVIGDLQAANSDMKDALNGIRGDIGDLRAELKALNQLVRDEKADKEKKAAEVERKLKALKAENAKILKALADIVSEAVEEAKVAIQAEAQAAAVAAVSDIKGGEF